MDLILSPGNVKTTMSAVGASSADLWKVPPHQIVVLPEYNIRVRNEAYNQRVRDIADSIKVNGFLLDHPLTGYVNRTEDGDQIVLIGGHRRLEAVLIAISEGYEILTVPVIIKPGKGTSMEDLLVDLKVGNDGEPITLLEQALLCQRLLKFGWDPQQMAKRLGYKDVQQVGNLLTLAAAPQPIRHHVAMDRISASLAITLLLKHGPKALEVVEKLVAGKGKKVTPKDVPAIRFKQHLRKQAEPMYRAIQTVQADPGWASLSKETQALLEETMRAPK